MTGLHVPKQRVRMTAFRSPSVIEIGTFLVRILYKCLLMRVWKSRHKESSVNIKMLPLEIICLTLLALVGNTECYPNGVSVDQACSNLIPVHGASPLSNTPPYNISFSPASYTAGQLVKVTLSSTGTGFMGFMIQARSNDSSCTDAFGTFNTSGNTRLACSQKALVHSDSNVKTTLTFDWIAPTPSVGPIIFRVTYVQSKAVYWTNIASNILLSTANALQCSSSGSPTQSSLTQSGSFTKDAECGISKGCFSSCEGTACSFSVSWQTFDQSTAVYTLKAAYQASGFYIALGFSSDDKMGSDSVMGCAYSSSKTVSFTAENIGKNTPTIFTDSEVNLTNSSYSNGVITCTITRPIVAKGKRYDVSQPWTLLFVLGESSISTNNEVTLQFHNKDYFISERSVKVSDKVDISSMGKDDPLVKAHGCLMVVAWVFFASIGLVVARFYKPVLTGTMCSQKIWFQVHRFSMVLVLVITAIAFIIIFVKENGEWSDVEGEASYLQGHPIMGVMVMILTILNPVMALFRPHPGTPKRPIFNWAHFLVGVSAHILGVITIFFGLQLQGATTPYYATYIMGAYVVWQLFVKLLLEIITRFNIFKTEPRNTFELNNGTDTKSGQSDENEKKKAFIKKVIFVIHCVVVSGLCAAIVAVIGVGYGGGDDD
ncbi:DOMON domain-containing protein frrs1L [Bulinus truncatus]|nr:DOMON domain-containing protein frrs1L [Bulinus truncatus]